MIPIEIVVRVFGIAALILVLWMVALIIDKRRG